MAKVLVVDDERSVRSNLVHILEVAKVNNIDVHDVHNDGTVYFEVEPGAGMRVMPMSNMKA